MMPGAMRSADVAMTNPGNALVQCRVADHIAAGMQMLVQASAALGLFSFVQTGLAERLCL